MRDVSDKRRANQNTHFISLSVFLKSCHLRDNVENILEPARPRMTIWRMRTAF